jgi:hypothetical protein
VDDSEKRWDNDDTGHGVANAAPFVPNLELLIGMMVTEDWVAEDPELHLLPHIEATIAAEQRFDLKSMETLDGCFVVDLEWLRSAGSWAELETDVFRLIASFSESTTSIHKTWTDAEVEYQVTTGTLPGDGPFATHGHTLLIRVGGDRIESLLKARRGG